MTTLITAAEETRVDATSEEIKRAPSSTEVNNCELSRSRLQVRHAVTGK